MKSFIAPKIISPFYASDVKIPRKLKKKVKKYCGVHWYGCNNGQRLWHYMEKDNIDYKSFIINKICEHDKKKINE